MAKKQKHRNDKEQEKVERFLAIAFVIILGILLIITLGIFFRREKIRKHIEEKEKKLQRLQEINDRLKLLEAQKHRIEKRERNILIAIRLGVAILLISLNSLYQSYILPPFEIPKSLGDILNFNGAILMVYAFVGFISYGTISNMLSALKAKLANLLRKRHLGSLEELELLLKEKEILKSEMGDLERNLALLQKSSF